MKNYECPSCKGEKGGPCHINTGLDSSQHRWEWIVCNLCSGTGTVSHEVIDLVNEGKRLSRIRAMNQVSLTELAGKFQCSCSDLSAVFFGRAHHNSIPGLKDYLEGHQTRPL